MSDLKNQEQLEGVGAAYTMLKQLFESLIANADKRRQDAWERRSVRGIAFCDSSIQFFRRCLELIEEDFVEFVPFAPLPLDENGDPYFPSTDGILVANLEVRSEGARLQLFEEDGTPIPNKNEENKE